MFVIILFAGATLKMEPVIVVGTSTKEKTDQNTNWTLCVICQVPNTNVKYSKLGDIGRNKLSNCVAERLEHGDDKYNDTTTRLKSVNLTTLPEVIFYHRKCYGIYTNPDHMKRLKDKVSEIASDATTTATNEPSTPSEKVLRRATRSHIPSLDKNLCIFCQTTKVTTTTSKVMTFDVSNSILKAAKCDFIMSCRLANMTDLVAEDALYHQQCRVEFMRRAVKTDVENKSSARDVCMTRLAAEVRDGVSQGHVYNLVDVWHRFKQIMSELGEDPGSYRLVGTRCLHVYQIVIS